MIASQFQRIEIEVQSPESPRWYQGALWFSDYFRKTVNRMVPGEAPQVILTITDTPGALGFLPDGALIVSSMKQRQLFRYSGGELVLYADLLPFEGQWLNDMVVDGDGRAYVGTRTTKVSPAIHHREPGGPDTLLIVEPGGQQIAVVPDICSPNGATVSPDGKTLTLNEIYARRITRFDRDAQGLLSNRRVLAAFDRTWPDGLSLDAEDGVWTCSPYSGEVVHVKADGTVDQVYDVPGAVACALGGNDRRMLYVVATDVRRLPSADPDRPHGSLYKGPGHEQGLRSPDEPGEVDTSGMFAMQVDVPGVGWP